MRVRSLTGLRGVAAVCVMLYHVPHEALFARFGLALFSKSYLCVDLFFALSGFVISIGYYDRVVGHPGVGSYRDFLINRLARVYPLHLIVVIAFAARYSVNMSGEAHPNFTAFNFLANLLMIQSWGFGALPYAGNSWSVSTELMAYLLFPIIAIWAFSRLFWLQAVAAVLLLVAVVTSGLGVQGPMDVVNGTSVLPLARCLAGFAFGVMAYRFALQPWCRRVFGHDAMFVLICVLMAIGFRIPGGDLMVALLCPLLVLTTFYDGPLVRALLSNRLVYHLGLISYSIYLWHPLFSDLASWIGRRMHAHGIVGYDPLLVVGLFAFTWLACWISYRLIEVRGHRMIKAIDERVRQRRPVPNVSG